MLDEAGVAATPGVDFRSGQRPSFRSLLLRRFLGRACGRRSTRIGGWLKRKVFDRRSGVIVLFQSEPLIVCSQSRRWLKNMVAKSGDRITLLVPW